MQDYFVYRTASADEPNEIAVLEAGSKADAYVQAREMFPQYAHTLECVGVNE